jgi:hypothetical protein
MSDNRHTTDDAGVWFRDREIASLRLMEPMR